MFFVFFKKTPLDTGLVDCPGVDAVLRAAGCGGSGKREGKGERAPGNGYSVGAVFSSQDSEEVFSCVGR